MSDEIKDQFRQAMRRLASTVTIVTTRNKGVIAGMTASAVTSLSMAPPSLLVCVNKTAGLHSSISSADYFCVNILRHGQGEISNAFAGKLTAEQRFDVGSWGHDKSVPYLRDAQAAIFCKRATVYEHGTHSIIVGEAVELMLGDPITPLVHVDGRYSAVTPSFQG